MRPLHYNQCLEKKTCSEKHVLHNVWKHMYKNIKPLFKKASDGVIVHAEIDKAVNDWSSKDCWGNSVLAIGSMFFITEVSTGPFDDNVESVFPVVSNLMKT